MTYFMSFLVCRFKYEKCQMENQHRSLFKLSKEAGRTLTFSFCFIVNMLDCELPVFGWACVRLDSGSPCRLLAGKTDWGWYEAVSKSQQTSNLNVKMPMKTKSCRAALHYVTLLLDSWFVGHVPLSMHFQIILCGWSLKFNLYYPPSHQRCCDEQLFSVKSFFMKHFSCHLKGKRNWMEVCSQSLVPLYICVVLFVFPTWIVWTASIDGGKRTHWLTVFNRI